MKTIWFTKKDLLVGGTELLIERVSKVFQNRGFSTVILYSSIIVEDIFQRYQLISLSIRSTRRTICSYFLY